MRDRHQQQQWWPSFAAGPVIVSYDPRFVGAFPARPPAGHPGWTRGVSRRAADSGRGRQRAPGGSQRQRQRRRRRSRGNPPAGLCGGLLPDEVRAPGSRRHVAGSSTVRFPKLRAPADTRGPDYEERTVALTFLRCLRDDLHFHISSDNEAAGKFDDLVLRWRYKDSAENYLLLVQLKHRAATHGPSEVTRDMLLQTSGNNRFGLAVYQESYRSIRDQLKPPFALLLSTNASLASDTSGMFVRRSLDDVPGAEFLDTGGTLYGLNLANSVVRRAVNDDRGFVEHFAIFCRQKDSEELEEAIRREIGELLADGEAEGYVCENLCREIRNWKLHEDTWLSEGWKKWATIVADYAEKFVCQCGDTSVRPPVEFRGVETVRAFVDSRNPARLAPLRRSSAPLTASKLHQALAGEPHLLVTARRYRQRRRQVLHVWPRFCKWLVILEDSPEDETEAFEELTSKLSPSRRLVFVSSKIDSSFVDTFASSEISNECWTKFLKTRISLNGENYLCHLRDLVGDAASLKKLLDNRPEAVITLSQLTGTLHIGQQLDLVPEYHISRRVVVRRSVTDDFFSSLGEKDVCIINEGSHVSLPVWENRDIIPDLRRLETVLGSKAITWPLLTIADVSDSSEVEQLCGRYPGVCFYAVNCSDDGWEVTYFSADRNRIQPYVKMRVVQAPEELDLLRRRVIMEGAPGTGKSSMLSAVARRVKASDPAYWIVKVDFSEFCDVFDYCDSSAEALEHVFKHVTSSDDKLGHLERTLLHNCLQHSARILCLVDGFDDLNRAHTGVSLKLLKQLTPQKGGMLVTARPAAKKPLEETLGTIACLLTTFSDVEWQSFLRNYCPTFAGSISSVTTKTKNLRLPLFCEIQADLRDLGPLSDVTELYNTFFWRKCENLWRKKQDADPRTDGGKELFEEQWKRYEEQLMYLATSALVHSRDRIGQRPFYPISKEFFVEAGIVRNSADGRPVFKHRTFAEFFLAKWCFARIGQKQCADIYREALLEKNLEFFQWTFDRMASKGHGLLELIVDGDEREVMALPKSRLDVSGLDRAGRSALHLATLYGSGAVVRRLGARAGRGRLQGADRLLGWTPLQYALELRRWPTAAALVEAGASLKALAEFPAGQRDFGELKNWLPDSTFQKFVKKDRHGKGTRSSAEPHKRRNEAKAATSPRVKTVPSDDFQQYGLNVFSVLQRDDWKSTVEIGKPVQVRTSSRRDSQPSDRYEKGREDGLAAIEHPSNEKAPRSSRVVVVRQNCLEPRVHSGKRPDGAFGQSTGPNTDSASEMGVPSQKSLQPDLHCGQRSGVVETTPTATTTSPPADAVVLVRDSPPNPSVSQSGCCRCCCSQSSVFAAFCAIFCCSSSKPDTAPDHTDSTVADIN